MAWWKSRDYFVARSTQGAGLSRIARTNILTLPRPYDRLVPIERRACTQIDAIG
jgi:hypothetical protein